MQRRVNKLLVSFVDRYLDQYRSSLVRPGGPTSFLWLSSRQTGTDQGPRGWRADQSDHAFDAARLSATFALLALTVCDCVVV